jgi:hypothetical protein
MSEWKRRTKEVSLENLPPQVASAIQQHMEQYNLGPILSDTLMCIQTDSEKTKKGLFGSSEIVQTVAVITPRWIVWTIDQPKSKPAVLSAQLIQATVQDYSQTPFAKMIPDSGIQVNGMFTDASEGASAFIGLEENVAGQKFRDVVIKAAAAAKK